MSATDERLKQLKEDLQRARAEQDSQRALRMSELAAAKQSRDEAALERHGDIMSQLRTMRELLGAQQESQAQCSDQTKQHYAEEMRWRRDAANQMSDVQATLASLRDERRAAHEQRAEEHARTNAGRCLCFFKIINCEVMRRRHRSKEIERAVNEVSRDVAETREQFLSVAEGTNIIHPLVFLTPLTPPGKQSSKKTRLGATRS